MATHDVLPFAFVFLAIGAAVEASACLDHWLSERWLAALAADLAVLLATWLVTNQQGLPEVYAPIPREWLLVAQGLLLLIYLSSTIVRTLLRGVAFTGFETVQCAAAFVIGVGGGLRLSHAGPAIGGLALVCGLACYVVSFVRLDRPGSHARNFYTYSTFAILLTLAASAILLPGAARWSAWLLLALACFWAGARFGRLTLRVHGALYLWLALAFSGALARAGSFCWQCAVDGSQPVRNRGGSRLCRAVLWAGCTRCGQPQHLELPRHAFRRRHPAGLAGGGNFGRSLHGRLSRPLRRGRHPCLLCHPADRRAGAGGAPGRLGGLRWPGLEIARLIYPLMLAAGCRLLLVDLHQDRKAAMVLSLLAYGAALMVLPRLTRARAAGNSAILR